nr:EOG090X0M4M [Ilyocryptus agilis]
MQLKKEKSTLPSVWTRIISRNSEWPDKDEFLDVIYWARQILAIVLGLIWGVLSFQGFIGLMLPMWKCNLHTYLTFAYRTEHEFCLVNAGLLYVYFSSFQSVDEEEYGGAWELTKEGFMTSFAGFLVTWTIVYSGIHF